MQMDIGGSDWGARAGPDERGTQEWTETKRVGKHLPGASSAFEDASPACVARQADRRR